MTDVHGKVVPIHDRFWMPFLWLVAAAFASSAVASGVVSLVGGGGDDGSPSFVALLAGQATYWLVLLVAYRRGASLTHTPDSGDDGTFPVKYTLEGRAPTGMGSTVWAGLKTGAIAVFVHVVVTNGTVAVAARWMGIEKVTSFAAEEQGRFGVFLGESAGVYGLGVFLLMAVVVAPFVEERFFRGYVFPVFKGYGGRHGAWASALLFSAAHAYVLNFVPVAVLGWLLAKSYDRHGRLAVPIIAHMTVNGFVAMVMLAGWGI